MTKEDLLALLKEGVPRWNEWRRTQSPFDGLDLSGVEIGNISLSRGNFRKVNFEGTGLSKVGFWRSDLAYANFSGVDLSSSDLGDTDLSSANLRRTKLYRSNLMGARLQEAEMDGAYLCEARVGSTEFGNCDLGSVFGLEQVNHWGPSTIGLDTIYKSRGKIPESFLRGCGVPESFITQMRSLVNSEDGIQFYSCFISHSTKDAEFATRLHGKMRDAHLRVWYAPEDMKGGEKLHEQIETAIRVYDKLLIVLSDASMQSEWVKDELRKAFREEYESAKAGMKKRKLFPIALCDYQTLKDWVCRDSHSGIDLAEEVREYFIPDFSRWKEHDQFEASFARLLEDLKAEGT